jgi:hypothetical protein
MFAMIVTPLLYKILRLMDGSEADSGRQGTSPLSEAPHLYDAPQPADVFLAKVFLIFLQR